MSGKPSKRVFDKRVFFNDLLEGKDDFVITEKLFVIILCICFSFSIYKNVNRFLKKGDIFFGVEKIENKYILDEVNSKNNLKIYFVDITKNNNNGWQGRLCWDIPFFCTYNKINVNKKNGYLIISK